MSFYCGNCEERGDAAESEIERLRQELERFARLYANEGHKNKVLLEVLSERDAELAKAREWIKGAPHRTDCPMRFLSHPHQGQQRYCTCGRDTIFAKENEQ